MGRLKEMAKGILGLIPLSPRIMFESQPDLTDSSKAVFDEMIRRGFNDKYKMVWNCHSKSFENYPEIKNVKYINEDDHPFIVKWLIFSSKCFITTNSFMYSNRKGQTSFYISHGGPIKDCGGYYVIPEEVDYLITLGGEACKPTAATLHYPLDKTYPLGYPRNDDLSRNHSDLKSLFGPYKKFIIWYPTFRNVKEGMTACSHDFPIVHDKTSLLKLNDTLAKLETLIVLKPHFAQNITDFESLSNIKVIHDDFFTSHGLSPYSFIGSFDALLTDYSSVYYDFLLCDKPIGMIWEDIEEYKTKPGLVDGFEHLARGGEKIYDINQLLEFIESVSEGKDNCLELRHDVMEDVHGENKICTPKVVDFIIEKAGL
ncbi:MAG: CDP-glycerol glycerophosphotransferase family protein [Candidatus Ornithospirochaeta sp.]